MDEYFLTFEIVENEHQQLHVLIRELKEEGEFFVSKENVIYEKVKDSNPSLFVQFTGMRNGEVINVDKSHPFTLIRVSDFMTSVNDISTKFSNNEDNCQDNKEVSALFFQMLYKRKLVEEALLSYYANK